MPKTDSFYLFFSGSMFRQHWICIIIVCQQHSPNIALSLSFHPNAGVNVNKLLSNNYVRRNKNDKPDCRSCRRGNITSIRENYNPFHWIIVKIHTRNYEYYEREPIGVGDGRAKQSLSTPEYLDINFRIARKWGDTGTHFIIAWTWLFSLLFMYYFKGMCDARTHYSNCQQFRWKPSQTNPSQPSSNTKASIAYLFICFIFRFGHNIKIHCAFPIDYLYIFCWDFSIQEVIFFD